MDLNGLQMILYDLLLYMTFYWLYKNWILNFSCNKPCTYIYKITEMGSRPLCRCMYYTNKHMMLTTDHTRSIFNHAHTEQHHNEWRPSAHSLPRTTSRLTRRLPRRPRDASGLPARRTSRIRQTVNRHKRGSNWATTRRGRKCRIPAKQGSTSAIKRARKLRGECGLDPK